MEGELIAFADMSDTAVTLRKKLSRLLNLRILLQLLTDYSFF